MFGKPKNPAAAKAKADIKARRADTAAATKTAKTAGKAAKKAGVYTKPPKGNAVKQAEKLMKKGK